MFTRNKTGATTEVLKTYKSAQLMPVLKAEGLFKSSRHQGLLRELKAMVFLPPDDYDRLYQATLNQFAEFVQVLPVVVSGPLSGLLNEGLARAVIALKHYLAENTDPDPLFLYALFTAALFLDVAKAVTNYKVILSTEEGAYIEAWHPFEGSMVGRADYFKLYPLAPIYQRIERSLTQLLAQAIMPRDAFLWIANDLSIYADWLEALGGDGGQGGTLAHLISLLPRDDIFKLLNALVQVPISPLDSQLYPYGEMFYQWLTEGIAKGDIAVNTPDAGVHLVAEGVFIERNKTFNQFLDVFKLPVNLSAVYSQFGHLMGVLSQSMVSQGAGAFLNATYLSKYQTGAGSSLLKNAQRSIERNGLVVKDAAIILNKMPAVSDSLKAQDKSMARQLPAVVSVESPSLSPKNR